MKRGARALALVVFSFFSTDCASHVRQPAPLQVIQPAPPASHAPSNFSWTCDASGRCNITALASDGHALTGLLSAPAPTTRWIYGDIHEVRSECGRGCSVTFFVDFRSDRASPVLVNLVASDAEHELVAIALKNSIAIFRMFGSREPLLEVTPTFALAGNIADAITGARFVDGQILELEYSGSDDSKQVARTSLAVAMLPPIERPNVRRDYFVPLAEVTADEIVRRSRAGRHPWIVEGLIPAGEHCAVADDASRSFEQWAGRQRELARGWPGGPESPVGGTRVNGVPALWRYTAATRAWSRPGEGAASQPPPQCVAALARYLGNGQPFDAVSFWRWTEEVLPLLRDAGVSAQGGTFPLMEVAAVEITSQSTNPDGTVTIEYRATTQRTTIGRAMGVGASQDRTIAATETYRKVQDGWQLVSGSSGPAENRVER